MKLKLTLCLPCTFAIQVVDRPINRRIRLTIPQAVKLAAEFGNVPVEGLLSDSRKRVFNDVRFIIYTLLRKNKDFKLSAIGKYFQRDHATVINGIKQCNALRSVDSEFRQLYNTISSAFSMDQSERLESND